MLSVYCAPAVVFAEQTGTFKTALESIDFGDAIVVTSSPCELSCAAVAIGEVLQTKVTAAVNESIEAIDADAPSVLMLTSGSNQLAQSRYTHATDVNLEPRARLPSSG